MNDSQPYPPGPAVPFRFLFLIEYADDAYAPDLKKMIREHWEKWVSGTEIVEDPSRWNECKGMVCYHENYISPTLRQMMQNFFARDRRESLVYQFDPVTRNFADRNEDWLRIRI